MNLAVKFYRDNASRPLGMPELWPHECREIGEATEYTAEPGPWLVMSVEEYNEYREAAKGLYEHYENQYTDDDCVPHPVMSFKGSWLRVKAWIYGDQPPAGIIPPEVGEWHE